MNYLVTFTYAHTFNGDRKYLSEIVNLNCDGLTQDNIKKIISDLSLKHVCTSPIDVAILNIIKLED